MAQKSENQVHAMYSTVMGCQEYSSDYMSRARGQARERPWLLCSKGRQGKKNQICISL